MKTPRQTNFLTGRVLAVGEAPYESAEASAAANADWHPEERAATLASLLGVLHRLGTACPCDGFYQWKKVPRGKIPSSRLRVYELTLTQDELRQLDEVSAPP
jgi:hypothetical protein